MVKFSATNNQNGMPVLGIGLSRENCTRLLAGNPIEFYTTGMAGLPAMGVMIMAGETEESITKAMIDAGAVDAERILEDSSLADPQAPTGVN